MKNYSFRLPVTVLFISFCFLLVLPGRGQDQRRDSYREEMEARVAAELQRRSRVLQWARTSNPSQRDIFHRLNQPVLEGTRDGYGRNMELSRQFRDRANEARRNRQEEAYRSHMETARAFRELAETNQMIHEGMMAGDQGKVNEGYKKIPELEATILQHTRRRPPRNWLTPDEIRRFHRSR